MTHQIAYSFTATLSLFAKEQGGRSKPVYNHYRPSFNFGSKQYYSGEISFEDVSELRPGDSAIAHVKLLPLKHISIHLVPGIMFKITEGEKIVGIGLINSIEKEEVLPN